MILKASLRPDDVVVTVVFAATDEDEATEFAATGEATGFAATGFVATGFAAGPVEEPLVAAAILIAAGAKLATALMFAGVAKLVAVFISVFKLAGVATCLTTFATFATFASLLRSIVSLLYLYSFYKIAWILARSI